MMDCHFHIIIDIQGKECVDVSCLCSLTGSQALSSSEQESSPCDCRKWLPADLTVGCLQNTFECYCLDFRRTI